MTTVVHVNHGHRLRDLVAAGSVIALGLAVALMVGAGETPTSVEIPCALLAAGCIAIFLAHAAGFVVDRIAEHFPALTRARRCPWLVIVGIPLLVALLAATQIDAAAWRTHAIGIADEVRSVLPVQS